MTSVAGNLYNRINRSTVATTNTVTKLGAVVTEDTLKTTGAEMTGNLIMDGSAVVIKNGAFLQVNDSNDTKSIQITGPASALSGDYTLELPATVPAANQILQVDTVVGTVATTKYATVAIPDQPVGTTDSPTFASLTLTAPLSVANGGTGSSLSIGLTPQFLVTDAGKVVQSGAAFSADGQIPVYSGTNNPFFRALKLIGTANQVAVTQDLINGELELSTPQDIAASSNVTFAKVTTATVDNATSLTLTSTGLQSTLSLDSDVTLSNLAANKLFIGHVAHTDNRRNYNVFANGNVDVRGSTNASMTMTVNGSGKMYEHRMMNTVVEFNSVTPVTLDATQVADGLYIRGVANLDITFPTGADLEAAFKTRHAIAAPQTLPTGTHIELLIANDPATTHKLTANTGISFVNVASPFTSSTGAFSRISIIRTGSETFDVLI